MASRIETAMATARPMISLLVSPVLPDELGVCVDDGKVTAVAVDCDGNVGREDDDEDVGGVDRDWTGDCEKDDED